MGTIRARFTSLIHQPRHKLLVFGAGAFGLVLVGVAVGFVVLLSGAYSTAATTQHFRLTHRLLDLGLQYSVRSASRDIEVPALDQPGMVEHGAACYVKHCVQCHGAPGVGPADEGKGLLPTPDPLTQTARDWPAQWLYYVTSKGVRMTGMPAWEYRISTEARWSTVAFLKQMPFLSADQYDALQASVNPSDCEPATELVPYSEDSAKITLRQYACDSCHIIEGVVGSLSYTGPVLVDWSKRKYIAGTVPNTHENLVRWIRDPQAVSPGTLMPDLDVAEAHAREMATYLLRLE
jgi:mono/diheme cytochrome c family protein